MIRPLRPVASQGNDRVKVHLTYAEDLMDAYETIERDGYVGRIGRMDFDGRPDDDCTGTVISVWHWSYRHDVNVEHYSYKRGIEADDLRTGLVNALDRWGYDWDKIERYLRAFYDVVGIDRIDWGNRGEATLVCLVTGGQAHEWGHPRAAARKLKLADLSEWCAYRDGEVYGYVVEGPDGNEIDSCWGYYGDRELEYIRSCIEQAVIADQALKHAEHAAMYRRLVNA